MDSVFISPKTMAKILLDLNCVSLKKEEPFRLPSGWASPGYIDCRKLISFPKIRREIVSSGLSLLKERGVLDGLTAVAGGESSGIPLAAWIADQLNLPLLYVRKRIVGRRQIEGVLPKDGKVLLVDDLMAAGTSKANFLRCLKDAGVKVQDIFVIFDYATFPTESLLKPYEVSIHSLTTWRDIFSLAQENAMFDQASLDDLYLFLENTSSWSRDHGGISTLSA